MSVSLHKVTFFESGDHIVLPVNTNLTSVEEYVDDEIPFSCRSGCCGSCVIEITSGEQKVSPATNDEITFLDSLGYQGDAFRLACQCKILGDITIKPI
ncbi:2Fe-2S iron-sulfur cluster-binding protein [Teredinibacter franksiae]|jgi:Ferredoxin|uniref:2Fe-2S iron-sulfur cluster-binding protein n=1 Tax=Teredinibacter franksiae TaxID=2761453 RepID=UPI001629EA5D|nr:2Fe-2S iron-sulfur cluster-binding protein [Teredinibacter franksiae]